MCSESFPKEFEKTTEVLPFTNYGLSSIHEFKQAEKGVQQLEWLKKAGLTQDEINLFQENEAGLLGQRQNIEANAMKEKLEAIYSKINKVPNDIKSSKDEEVQASTSTANTADSSTNKIITKSLYPVGHPMNSIKEIEQNLFSHLKNDDIMPINKRRKLLRRLERKKDKILALDNKIVIGTVKSNSKIERLDSLWDVKEMPRKRAKANSDKKSFIGPKKRTMYTIKDNKVVRLKPVNNERNEEYEAVDIVVPVNNAEVQLLEGTKMCIDDIKKIDRFKDYKPGIPSKILYLKNIAPSVTLEQLSLLFNQFTLANGRPADVRLLSGRMRGQAFVTFQSMEIAIQALTETNGTIMSGRPVIAQFGRNTNRIPANR